jgi:hypothetical protein
MRKLSRRAQAVLAAGTLFASLIAGTVVGTGAAGAATPSRHAQVVSQGGHPCPGNPPGKGRPIPCV